MAAAQADTPGGSTRDRKESVESSGWLGRNMRKMRAKRDRAYESDRTMERELSFEYSLSTSPNTLGLERMDSSVNEGPGSGVRSRGPADGYGIDGGGGPAPAVWASAEEDTAEIRYMPAAGPDEVPRVKAATTDKLVEWLTSHKYSGTFLSIFLLLLLRY
jgi:hypothetical protein